ncbi:MAG TPA: alpha/beta hydrolase [Sphingomicrobium sp.]|jgi:pimeloyl-ACP methyl ester carboxylesterase
MIASAADPETFNVNGRSIAYRARPGSSPTLVFLPGYASDMEGTKALALDGFAQERGSSMLRLDYSGTGSSAGRFEDGTLALWLEEALAAVDELTDGPLILVGSSMGGWIALHLALLRPERVQALAGIAAAPDFTEWGFGPPQRAMLEREGRLGQPDPEGRATPHLMTQAFWQSGQALRLLDGEIAIDCPVRLIHGEDDRDVPLDVAFRTMRALRSSDVQLNVIKGGGHRLSESHEIAAILHTVEGLLERQP